MNKIYDEKLSKADFKELYELYKNNEKLNKRNAFNVFNVLNLRENSHTSLIKWLLSEQEEFRQKFSKLLGFKNPIKEIHFEKTSFKYHGKNNYMDCIFTFKKNNKDCVCVIESKLDAKLCIIDKETQIERYCKHLNNKYDKKEKHFIYLCTSFEKNSMNKRVQIGGNKYIGRFKTNYILDKTEEIYNKFINFHKIEFSDIILILFDILYDNNSNKRKYCTNQDIKNLIDNLNTKQIIKNFMDKLKLDIDKIYTMEEFKNIGYKKPQRYNIDLEYKLKIMNEDERKQLLSQYIEYWEDWAPFIDGYTKIINGVFLYDIMKYL